MPSNPRIIHPNQISTAIRGMTLYKPSKIYRESKAALLHIHRKEKKKAKASYAMEHTADFLVT